MSCLVFFFLPNGVTSRCVIVDKCGERLSAKVWDLILANVSISSGFFFSLCWSGMGEEIWDLRKW